MQPSVQNVWLLCSFCVEKVFVTFDVMQKVRLLSPVTLFTYTREKDVHEFTSHVFSGVHVFFHSAGGVMKVDWMSFYSSRTWLLIQGWYHLLIHLVPPCSYLSFDFSKAPWGKNRVEEIQVICITPLSQRESAWGVCYVCKMKPLPRWRTRLHVFALCMSKIHCAIFIHQIF